MTLTTSSTTAWSRHGRHLCHGRGYGAAVNIFDRLFDQVTGMVREFRPCAALASRASDPMTAFEISCALFLVRSAWQHAGMPP